MDQAATIDTAHHTCPAHSCMPQIGQSTQMPKIREVWHVLQVHVRNEIKSLEPTKKFLRLLSSSTRHATQHHVLWTGPVKKLPLHPLKSFIVAVIQQGLLKRTLLFNTYRLNFVRPLGGIQVLLIYVLEMQSHVTQNYLTRCFV